MPVKLTNLATSTLAGAINSSVTSLAISSGDVDKFPTLSEGEWFPLVVVDNAGNREIMKVTDRDGATLTVVRGQEGTAAISFGNGSLCELRTTAAALAELSLASGARAVTQDAGTDDETISTTAFVQAAINAMKAGVSIALDTFAEIAAYITDAATGVPSRMRKLGTGAALPGTDEGPIWHADYNSVMTWQTFNANGASYTGYASVDLGRPLKDGRSTPRTGELKRNGASLSKTTYAALWNWALHNGRVVTLGSWTAGPYVFADNGDGTFKIPDNRGETERGWDDGRGVDADRVFGSWQDGETKSHTHTGTAQSAGAHTHTFWVGQSPGSSESFDTDTSSNGDLGSQKTTSSSGAHTHTLSINSTGGAETRSRNVALLYTIKF